MLGNIEQTLSNSSGLHLNAFDQDTFSFSTDAGEPTAKDTAGIDLDNVLLIPRMLPSPISILREEDMTVDLQPNQT